MKMLYLVCCLLFITTSAFGEKAPYVQRIVESHGYTYLDNASGIKILSSGTQVLRVFSNRNEAEQQKSIIVVIDGDSLVPIDEPVWSGGGVEIELLDINYDGREDIVVSEYYEPDLNVRIFLSSNQEKYIKVFQGVSASKPTFVELIENSPKDVKELILTRDPYGYVYDALFVPKLYLFDGGTFELQ